MPRKPMSDEQRQSRKAEQTKKRGEKKEAEEKILNKKFSECRRKLQEEFGENAKKAFNEAKPILTYTLVARFLAKGKPTKEEHFDKSSKERLIYFYEKIKSPKSITYRYFSTLIGQSEIEFDNISRITGNYKYCRPYLKESEAEGLDYVLGDISIFYDDGVPCFEHRSHNWKEDRPGPEHTGYIFLKKSHVFMLGFREGVIRLAILHVNFSVAEKSMNGLVLSKRTEVLDNAFSAKFVMIHEKNKKSFARYEEIPERPEDTHTKRRINFNNDVNSTVQYLLLP